MFLIVILTITLLTGTVYGVCNPDNQVEVGTDSLTVLGTMIGYDSDNDKYYNGQTADKDGNVTITGSHKIPLPPGATEVEFDFTAEGMENLGNGGGGTLNNGHNTVDGNKVKETYEKGLPL